MANLRHFRFWCYKVLPLVYDDALSYYENICKVIDYLNKVVDSEKEQGNAIEGLKSDLAVVQKWIDDFDTSFAEQIIKDYLATMIFVEISDAGYFVYFIPEEWSDITFNTTGLDISIEGYDYGHLVLSY